MTASERDTIMPGNRRRVGGTDRHDLPAKLAAPARRALAAAGYSRLEQLSGIAEGELLKLHGMGPKALEQIRTALREAGLPTITKD